MGGVGEWLKFTKILMGDVLFDSALGVRLAHWERAWRDSGRDGWGEGAVAGMMAFPLFFDPACLWRGRSP
jgi:hypothetical protein